MAAPDAACNGEHALIDGLVVELATLPAQLDSAAAW
jgi:hypothetical protein